MHHVSRTDFLMKLSCYHTSFIVMRICQSQDQLLSVVYVLSFSSLEHMIKAGWAGKKVYKWWGVGKSPECPECPVCRDEYKVGFEAVLVWIEPKTEDQKSSALASVMVCVPILNELFDKSSNLQSTTEASLLDCIKGCYLWSKLLCCHIVVHCITLWKHSFIKSSYLILLFFLRGIVSWSARWPCESVECKRETWLVQHDV